MAEASEPLTPAHGPPLSSQAWTGFGNGRQPRTAKDTEILSGDLEDALIPDTSPTCADRDKPAAGPANTQSSAISWKRTARRAFIEEGSDYENHESPQDLESPPKRKKQQHEKTSSDPLTSDRLADLLGQTDAEVVSSAKPQLRETRSKGNVQKPRNTTPKTASTRSSRGTANARKKKADSTVSPQPATSAKPDRPSKSTQKQQQKAGQKKRKAKQPYRTSPEPEPQPSGRDKPRGIQQNEAFDASSPTPASPTPASPTPASSPPHIPSDEAQNELGHMHSEEATQANDPIEISSTSSVDDEPFVSQLSLPRCSSASPAGNIQEEMPEFPDASQARQSRQEQQFLIRKDDTKPKFSDTRNRTDDDFEPRHRHKKDKQHYHTSPKPPSRSSALHDRLQTPAVLAKTTPARRVHVSRSPSPKFINYTQEDTQKESDPFVVDRPSRPTDFTAQLLNVASGATRKHIELPVDGECERKSYVVGDAMRRALTADRVAKTCGQSEFDADRHLREMLQGQAVTDPAYDSMQREKAEREKWKQVADPAIGNLGATMSAITTKVVRFLVSEQDAIKDVVTEYEDGGLRAIRNVRKRHEAEQKEALKGMEQQMAQFRKTCREAERNIRAVSATLASVKLDPLVNGLQGDGVLEELRALRDEYRK